MLCLLSSSLDFCINPAMWAAFLAKSLLSGRGGGAERCPNKTWKQLFKVYFYNLSKDPASLCVGEDWEEIVNCLGGSVLGLCQGSSFLDTCYSSGTREVSWREVFRAQRPRLENMTKELLFWYP